MDLIYLKGVVVTGLKLTDIKGVGSVKAKLLISHGINSVSDLMNCSVYELCLVPGINQTSAFSCHACRQFLSC